MMRKLALTVFAISLTAFGCGSDSGSNNKDTGVDAVVAKDGGNKDTGPAKDTGPTVDMGNKDTTMVSPDAGDAMVNKDGSTVSPDAKLDGAKLDTGTTVKQDGSVDTSKDAPAVDAPAVDAPGVDASDDASGDAGNNG